MAEYRRFVAYVYEYQKEKKGSNCGFVKIEVRGEICRIELHLQCPGLMPESTCSVYGFVRNRGLLDGILLGGCVEKVRWSAFWKYLQGIWETVENLWMKWGE